jgi:glyoxylase-like metal-dependent hydrolase (beta-lactamase superfamily II)
MSGSENFIRYNVGKVEVTVVKDGQRTFPLPDHFVVNASKNDINEALAAASLPRDEMTIHFNPLALRIDNQIIVIDTGNGAAAHAASNGAVGQFADNLKASGIDPKDVNTVVISHFHGDHINGLLTSDNQRVFPNAKILVPAPEWDFWMDDGEMSMAPAGRQDAFKNARHVLQDHLKGDVSRYEWGQSVVPGLLAIETAGHTPGHTSFMLSSRSDRLFIQCDVTNHPALFVRNPTWHAAFDIDPGRAEATRRRTYDLLAAEQVKVQAFHYPFPSFGFIEKDGSRYHVVSKPGSDLIW